MESSLGRTKPWASYVPTTRTHHTHYGMLHNKKLCATVAWARLRQVYPPLFLCCAVNETRGRQRDSELAGGCNATLKMILR